MSSTSSASGAGAGLLPYNNASEWMLLIDQLQRIAREHQTPRTKLAVRLRTHFRDINLVLGRTGNAVYDDSSSLQNFGVGCHIEHSRAIEFTSSGITVGLNFRGPCTLEEVIATWSDSRNKLSSVCIDFKFESSVYISYPSINETGLQLEAALRHPAIADFAASFPRIANAPQRNLSVVPWVYSDWKMHVTFEYFPDALIQQCHSSAEKFTQGFDADAIWRQLLIGEAVPDPAYLMGRQSSMRLLSGRAANADVNTPYGSAWMLPGALPFSYLPDAVLRNLSSFIPLNSDQAGRVFRLAQPYLLLPESHSLIYRNQTTGASMDLNFAREEEWRRLFDWLLHISENKDITEISVKFEIKSISQVGRINDRKINALSALRDTLAINIEDLDFKARNGIRWINGAFYQIDFGIRMRLSLDEVAAEQLKLLIDCATEDKYWNMCRISFRFPRSDISGKLRFEVDSAFYHPVIRSFARAFPGIAQAPEAQMSVVAYVHDNDSTRVDFLLYKDQLTKSCHTWTQFHTGGLDCRQAWLLAKSEAETSRKRRQCSLTTASHFPVVSQP